MMDMSDAFGPELMDAFSIVRREETLVLGRPSFIESTTAGHYGVVTSAGSNDLDRLPEGIKFTRGISVVTQVQVRGAGAQGPNTYQPDIIEWRGSRYVVVHVDLYPHAGSGFWQVIAESMTTVEPL